MSLTEALFVAALPAGIVFRIAGLFVTRQNWRADVRPFGRHSNPFHIANHPAHYAVADALPRIRILNTIGGVLLFISACALIAQVITQFAGR